MFTMVKSISLAVRMMLVVKSGWLAVLLWVWACEFRYCAREKKEKGGGN
jgi:hypothetical protein